MSECLRFKIFVIVRNKQCIIPKYWWDQNSRSDSRVFTNFPTQNKSRMPIDLTPELF
jgi:uncharacterized protein YjfI (DUF2170 family)